LTALPSVVVLHQQSGSQPQLRLRGLWSRSRRPRVIDAGYLPSIPPDTSAPRLPPPLQVTDRAVARNPSSTDGRSFERFVPSPGPHRSFFRSRSTKALQNPRFLNHHRHILPRRNPGLRRKSPANRDVGFRSAFSQIRGFSGGFPGIRQRDRVAAQSTRRVDIAQPSDPRGASHRTSWPVIAAMRS
jgi:hypothetical protein